MAQDTGISPIMGFLQARANFLRKERYPSLAPCLVYFGCRDSSETLYAEQLRRWLDEGVVTELYVAMSREGPKVQALQPPPLSSFVSLLCSALFSSSAAHLLVEGHAGGVT